MRWFRGFWVRRAWGRLMRLVFRSRRAQAVESAVADPWEEQRRQSLWVGIADSLRRGG